MSDIVIRDWFPTGEHRDRLLALLRENYWLHLADQIEAQTKPPKPAQPKGIGAVVEDSDHRLWIRHTNDPGTFPWICYGVVGARGWFEIDAVTVLSEGVTR